MKPTPQGGFSANEMYDMLRERDFVVKEIPKGQKNIHRFSHAVMATRKMTVNQNIYFGEECTRLVHYWAVEKIKMAGHI